MDEETRAWLEKLDDAAQRALEDLRRLDDPSRDGLVSGLEAFRERIAAQQAAAQQHGASAADAAAQRSEDA